MSKLLITILVICLISTIAIFAFVRSGEWLVEKFPHSGFSRWWRRNVVDRDPWE